METIVTQKELLFAAEQGANQAQDFNLKSLVCYFIEDESVETGPQASEDAKKEILGDVELLSEDQKSSMLALKEPAKYNTMKLKRVSLSFSGASVFFFTPYRADGTPMPASVMKFDSKECVEDEVAKTEKYRGLFGSTTPQVGPTMNDGDGLQMLQMLVLLDGLQMLADFVSRADVLDLLQSVATLRLFEKGMALRADAIGSQHSFQLFKEGIVARGLGDLRKYTEAEDNAARKRTKEAADQAHGYGAAAQDIGCLAHARVWRLQRAIRREITQRKKTDAYNALLLRSMKELKAMLRLKIRRSKDEAEKIALAGLESGLLQGPEAFQFWCCECWKLLNWIVTRKVSYLRRSDPEQMVEEEDDECEGMDWEEDSLEEHRVKDLILVDKEPSGRGRFVPEGPCSIMQIDLCGGVFGLPEFAKAPPVQTLASILEVELESPSHQVEVIPIINEALERRMFHFTMSARKIKTLSLANTYKLEGAKRGAKNPALAAGFQRPVEIDELDPDGPSVDDVERVWRAGHMIQELCGRKQTVRARDLFQKFADMEQSLSEIQRKVVVGLSHNDLHGGNLLVDSQGLVWLIDFATVKEDQHVLMDLTKFLSACTFMYLQDKVNEKHVKSLAKMLSCTPDATTDLPLAFLSDASEDPIAIFFFRIISRLRFCMCVYESGPGSPENDGLPFAIALFSWSARMLSYSEPSLYQKTRALYWSIAGMQRLLWSIGHDVGPTATKWIEENRSLWEGQKGRRLSSSVATDKQAVAAYQFELELPTYLSQAGASEAWSSDILTREKVNVSESCVPLTSKFDGRLNTRSHSLSAKAWIS
ncbi:Hypothetical protein SCF082_LOCUS6503 [Durusdinium trenchii]|uniref:Aminoglycoside phosphotransferase domain-containing protein n=1 Tax=Durusdinium trenchii TaxID=1381693 RepID=A0ABP0IGF5_9DINO